MKKYLVFLVLLFSVTIVNANSIQYYDGSCYYDGSALFEFNSIDTNNKIFTSGINLTASYLLYDVIPQNKVGLEGVWSREFIIQSDDTQKEFATFKTKEVSFTKRGNYLIEATYNLGNQTYITNGTLVCPEFVFSCTNLYLEIVNCTTIDNAEFEANLVVRGLNQSVYRSLDLYNDVAYYFVLDKRYTDKEGKYSDRGSIPFNHEFDALDDNKYVLRAKLDDNNVRSLTMKFLGMNECLDGRNYLGLELYSNKECTSTSRIVKEEQVLTYIEPEEILNITNITFGNNVMENGVSSDKGNGFLKFWVIFLILVVIFFLIKRLINKNKAKEIYGK